MEDITAEVLRCRRIEVFDDEGVMRVVIGTDRKPDLDWDYAFVGLCAPDGSEHVSVYCEAATAGLELWENGNTVAAVGSNRDGVAGVELNRAEDGEGVVRMENTVPATFMMRYDAEGGASTLGRFNVKPSKRWYWPFG